MTTGNPDNSPVFIHSMFRSGSTYLFNVFRRSPNGYWCYQEPENEALWHSDDWQLGDTADKNRQLRHPLLDKPYFYEFFHLKNEIKALYKKEFSYDHFFRDETSQDVDFRDYLTLLLERANGRPVLQFCRSFGRLRLLAADFPGVHIFLWRNPWDQWWSYKVNAYFETANLLIVNGTNVPELFLKIRKLIGIPEFHDQSVTNEFEYYRARRLRPEESYLLFYALWSYALLQSIGAVQCSLNIDRLSDSDSYRQEMLASLSELGIGGIDFSDCKVARGCYSEIDSRFFKAIEEKVHYLMLECGYRHEDLDTLLEWRAECPPAQAAVAAGEAPTSQLTADRMREDLARVRELALRYDDENSGLRYQALEKQALQQQLLEQQRTTDQVWQEKQALTGELLQAHQEAQALEQRLADETQASERLQSEKQAIGQQFAELTQQTDQLRQDRQALEAQLAEQKELALQLQSEKQVIEQVWSEERQASERLQSEKQAIEQQFAELTQQNDQLRRAQQAIEQQLIEETQASERLQSEKQAIGQQFAELTQQNDQLRQDRQALEAQLAEQKELALQLRSDKEVIEQRLKLVWAATSWRVTAPLRALKIGFRHLKKRTARNRRASLTLMQRGYLWTGRRLLRLMKRSSRLRRLALKISRRFPKLWIRLRYGDRRKVQPGPQPSLPAMSLDEVIAQASSSSDSGTAAEDFISALKREIDRQRGRLG